MKNEKSGYNRSPLSSPHTPPASDESPKAKLTSEISIVSEEDTKQDTKTKSSLSSIPSKDIDTKKPKPIETNSKDEAHPIGRKPVVAQGPLFVKNKAESTDPERKTSDTNHNQHIPESHHNNTTKTNTASGIGQRAGEGVLGLGNIEIEVTTITDHEASRYEQEDILNAEIEIMNNLAGLSHRESSIIPIPKSLRRMILFGGLSLFSIVFLFAINQALGILTSLSQLPLAFQWLFGIFAIVLSFGLVGFSIGGLAYVFKLRKRDKIELRTLKALKQRHNLRELAKHRHHEAAGKLNTYLKEYPLDKPSQLLKTGFKASEINTLKTIRQRLLTDYEHNDTQLIDEFYSSFQANLNSISERLITQSSRQAMVAAIFGPLDSLTLLGINLSMLEKIMVVYNLRYERTATVQLLVKAMRNILTSEALEFGVEAGTKAITQAFGETLSKLFGDTWKSSGGNLLSSGASQVAQSLINQRMTRRIGKHAVEMLQPVGRS